MIDFRFKLWKFRVTFRSRKWVIRLLNYAHRNDVIDTWKHSLIEKIIYGIAP